MAGLAVLLLCLGTAPPQEPAPEAISFRYHERLVFLEATLNGEKEIVCLLDTGASKSAVDATVGRELGLTVTRRDEVEGSAGVVEVDMVALGSLAIGERVVKDLEVTMYDLGGLLAPPGTRVGAIVGFDFLRGGRFTLDYEERTLSMSSDEEEPGEGWVAVPMQLDNGIPRVSALLDETVPADLRLDTGASIFESKDVYVNVTEQVWGALQEADPALEPSSYLTATGLGGELKLPVARIASLKLGPIEVRDPFVIVQPKQGYFARPDAVGFVGNNFLEKQGRVVLDYAGKRLLFPGE